jgi:hypothetical protein
MNATKAWALAGLFLLVAVSLFSSFSFGQTYPGGIVYGPKAAFNINAPEGWVLDNESGSQQGMPCVLYPKGQSWADAKRSCMPRSRARSLKM